LILVKDRWLSKYAWFAGMKSMAIAQYIAAKDPVADPACSICIANFNGKHMLDDCLNSIAAQRGDISVEILVHDDASSDGSVEFLLEKYPHVAILAGDVNVGFCIGNNRMVKQARGTFILLLNNDAALWPDSLETLYSAASDLGGECILTVPQYDWVTGSLVDRGSLLDLFYNPVPNVQLGHMDVAYTVGACMFMQRRLWLELGGLPEWMGSMAEDVYLCCLARLRGLPVQAVQASGYRHRQGATFGGNRVDSGKLNTTFRRRRLTEYNKTAVMIICTPTWMVWLLLAAHLTALALEGAAVTLVRRDGRVWSEIYGPTFRSISKSISDLLVQRREQQSARRVSLRAYLKPFTWFPHKLRMLVRHGFPSIH
jgi:GT2 family glycosyltransferase